MADDLINPLRLVGGWGSLSPETTLRIREVSALDAEMKNGRRINQLHLPQLSGSCEEYGVGYWCTFSWLGLCNGPEWVPNGLKVWGPPPLVRGGDGHLDDRITRCH